nr:adenylate kinase [Ipomoea batatas]
MAACSYSALSWCSASIPKSSSTSPPSLSLYPVNARGLTGISLSSSTRLQAKFEKFQGQENLEQDFTDPSSLDSQSQPSPEEEEAEEEDDSCLPNDLEGAVRQSGQAGATFVSSGGMRAIVELLIPQLQFLDDEGAQAELWELSRIFLNTLIEETGCQRVKAIFPDAGAAALLKYQWKDAAFGFSSLGDRKPVENEDEIIVMVVPDYQMLEYVERIASNLSDDPPRPLIMWNPRLVSEDVGVGINVRRLRRNFLRCWDEELLDRGRLWKVFYDDKDRLGRYLLAKEQISRPTTEELEIIFGEVDEKQEKGTSLFDQAAGIFSSINRFMKVISR